MKYKILDCTLRDGGYYNNWDFSSKLAQDYLNAASKAGIKYIELGFRSLKKSNYKGPNWYTTDSYINNLTIPKNINLGVMVNVFEVTSNSLSLEKTIDALFKKAKFSKIRFVRLASHFKEFNEALKICKILKKKGYFVAVNLMQISQQTKQDIIEVGKKSEKFKPDVLYFADSLGGMNSKKISDVLTDLRLYWTGEIGIHTHDNLGKALSNSLYALQNQVTWIDSTIMGMGRGPGNAKTEVLILELNNLIKTNFDLLPILKIIKKHFVNLKNIYNWGTNPFYHLAGKYSIHPTYIQEMLTQKFDDTEILETINQLKGKQGNKYDVNLIRPEFQKPIKITKGNWSPKAKFKNKDILFISSGPKLLEYKKEVERYIRLKKPIVIALKTEVKINKKLIDYYTACNPLRIIAEADLYKNIKKPVIIPHSLVTNEIKKKFNKLKTLNFGTGVENGKFEFYEKCALIPRLYTLAYALSFVTSGQASKILLAGFDGYGDNDRRTKIIDEIFTNYSSHKKSLKIKSITPTSYSFVNTSIYAIE